MKKVFFTGATGVIGSAATGLFVSDPGVETTILVRGQAGDRETEKKLARLYAFVGLSPEEAKARIKVVFGDVCEDHLGLTAETYRGLTAGTTHILHCAGDVRLNHSLERARRSAVESVKHIMALARACPALQKLEYLSTVGAAGRMQGEVPEEPLVEGRAFRNSYEQAKAEAEDLLWTAGRDIAFTVHRPSMVVGDSQTGRVISFQVFYHLCGFLTGEHTCGLFPPLGETRLDIVPLDCVARALYLSAGDQSLTHRVLQLASGAQHEIGLEDLRRRVRERAKERGRRLPPVITLPRGLCTAGIKAGSSLLSGRRARRIKSLTHLLEYLDAAQSFANGNFLSLLARHGFVLPSPEVYLNRIFAYRESAPRGLKA